ncbi:MAG TPA: transketolase C-terminal domain-containing protein [Anaerolineae bacterium]|nr:transketolase C-terminal domain-containing protein [Anaerolineae bacterium]
MSIDIFFIPQSEFNRVNQAGVDENRRLALLADMCRLNALATVKRAGSGHLGSSFSSLDIVTWLYFHEMNTASVGISNPNRDIYFSSKGHDVPGLYAVLYALGILPEDQFLNLRRIAGTPGHPAVGTPGVEANSGSLGMGISKAKGMAWAKHFQKHGGRVFLMTGDGEWQEGQNFEGLQTAAHQHITNLTVIVDHNKVQSDKLVSEILDLGDLGKKFDAFGWHVARCDGHDFNALERVMEEFERVKDRPKILIADTLKGRGVSFMEHPAALKAGNGLYRWHAGAPDDQSYLAAHTELSEKINARLQELNLPSLSLRRAPPVEPTPRVLVPTNKPSDLSLLNELGEPVSQAAQQVHTRAVSDEYVVEAYGKALAEIAETIPNLVVIDADLTSDCRLRAFEAKFPERFIENGIAEQDMVSMAGGLARQGLLPVVNSFASFLAARANEQIYNNACEKSHIIYAMHYAGLIPAGPGLSHQSIRDISLVRALPNVIVLQPCNAVETKWALDYCVRAVGHTCVLRLNIGPSPRVIELPSEYSFAEGRGAILRQGRDAAIIGYGPVMLHEALLASELLESRGVSLRVINLPWLSQVNAKWFDRAVDGCSTAFVIEDHSPHGGLADMLLETMSDSEWSRTHSLYTFGVEDLPMWGTPVEVLKYHGLDGATVADRILRTLDRA